MKPEFVAVLATMDTKSAEARFVRDELTGHGLAARLVDTGLRPCPGADVAAAEVAGAGGHELADLREHARRDVAMAAMGDGAGVLLRGWLADGRLLGVIGIGGNQGTSIAAAAVRELPYGLPKVVVSTVASGNVRGFVGDSDITMMFAVGDLLGGPNEVTGPVLRRAAAALAGMISVRDQPWLPESGRPVAVTAFGNTHAAVTSASARLAAAGRRAVAFHASGACGSAMERLVEDGMFAGVLDLTTHELLGELEPADIYAPVRPGRLTAAGRRALPQVIAPGGLEYYCFGAEDTIPARLRGRAVHHHNPRNTNVRADADELAAVARLLAARANAARGPTAVLVPLRGWSEVGAPGGALHDPAANAAFVHVLHAELAPSVELRELDMTINDPRFGTEAAEVLLGALTGTRRSEVVRG
ncbi:Tm-1-like ATP-binding domain-containing protein [Pseudonocardia acaciae]|uniref:Tm-1-like ATP-binding domain-containing protein n=1 Tax=Pseudonocardia acaciae TaxID=551276 RepID=UPI00055E5FF6|nr:Tm-1-like ATP-binding domain-containing protein [Pseudonocardia acaciae]